MIDAFIAAARGGDFDTLLKVLDPDVVLRADGGAVALGSAKVVRGAANVARQARAFSSLGVDMRPALVNGAAGTVSLRDGRPFAIAAVTIRNRRIVAMDVFAGAGALRQVDPASLDAPPPDPRSRPDR